LALLFRIDDVHLMAWIKEAELSAEGFGNFTRVWRDVWRLWRNGNKYLHKEVARWNIGRIERTNEANFVFGVCGMESELLMEFADRCLFWRFVPLNLAPREGDLPAMTTVFRTTNQQHLAVVRVWINALATPRRAAAAKGQRRHQERSHHCNARIATCRRIQIDRLKARKAKRGERVGER
jgi:hypothetical protein